MLSDINSIISKFSNRRLINANFGSFYHFSLIFTKKKGVIYPISYGENQIRYNKSIHAEVDAIDKIRDIGKFRKIFILVVRITKSGEITISKPCKSCIEKMNSFNCKNYKISRIYYSNKEGDIVKSSLDKLNIEPCKHISRMDRKK